ncbi:MAG: hypothetical protein K6E24_02205, partial [bacterium]|nr:hypothetical protein [bacterium]
MKYNEKQFYQSKTEPFETQEMENGSKIELHYMNEEPFYMENINKSRFLAWASADGKNYKLFVDKGLYEETSELYSKDVNEIWMSFWAKIDKMRKNYIFYIMLPMLAVFLIAFILISILIPNTMWVLIVALVVVLFGSLFASSMLSRKMQMANINAANEVRNKIGIEKFKAIVEAQDKYIEKYYADLQAKYEEEDRLAEETQNLDEIEAIENDKKVDDSELTV